MQSRCPPLHVGSCRWQPRASASAWPPDPQLLAFSPVNYHPRIRAVAVLVQLVRCLPSPARSAAIATAAPPQLFQPRLSQRLCLPQDCQLRLSQRLYPHNPPDYSGEPRGGDGGVVPRGEEAATFERALRRVCAVSCSRVTASRLGWLVRYVNIWVYIL